MKKHNGVGIGVQPRHKMVRIASVPASMIGTPKVGNKRVKVVSESDLESDTPLMPFSTKPYITIYDTNKAQHFSIDLARNYVMKSTCNVSQEINIGEQNF